MCQAAVTTLAMNIKVIVDLTYEESSQTNTDEKREYTKLNLNDTTYESVSYGLLYLEDFHRYPYNVVQLNGDDEKYHSDLSIKLFVLIMLL